jgi:hypothetical protein
MWMSCEETCMKCAEQEIQKKGYKVFYISTHLMMKRDFKKKLKHISTDVEMCKSALA